MGAEERRITKEGLGEIYRWKKQRESTKGKKKDKKNRERNRGNWATEGEEKAEDGRKGEAKPAKLQNNLTI